MPILFPTPNRVRDAGISRKNGKAAASDHRPTLKSFLAQETGVERPDQLARQNTAGAIRSSRSRPRR